mgnify:CR=1 FL=1|jgi:hypothetical protein
MECSICFETFILTKNDMKEYLNCKDDVKFEKVLQTTMKDSDKFMKMQGLMIKEKENLYKCPTPGCKRILCRDCFEKSGGDLHIGENYTCPFCKLIDYKYNFTCSVLNELLEKTMGKEEFKKYFINKLMKKI